MSSPLPISGDITGLTQGTLPTSQVSSVGTDSLELGTDRPETNADIFAPTTEFGSRDGIRYSNVTERLAQDLLLLANGEQDQVLGAALAPAVGVFNNADYSRTPDFLNNPFDVPLGDVFSDTGNVSRDIDLKSSLIESQKQYLNELLRAITTGPEVVASLFQEAFDLPPEEAQQLGNQVTDQILNRNPELIAAIELTGDQIQASIDYLEDAQSASDSRNQRLDQALQQSLQDYGRSGGRGRGGLG
jgi:hypothetical protein